MSDGTVAQVLVLFAGLSTCDPGNILDSIKAAKQQRVRASVIGLAAEVRICRVITDVRFPAVRFIQYVALPPVIFLHCFILNQEALASDIGVGCCSQTTFCNSPFPLSTIYSPLVLMLLYIVSVRLTTPKVALKLVLCPCECTASDTRHCMQAVPALQQTWHIFVRAYCFVCCSTTVTLPQESLGAYQIVFPQECVSICIALPGFPQRTCIDRVTIQT